MPLAKSKTVAKIANFFRSKKTTELKITHPHREGHVDDLREDEIANGVMHQQTGLQQTAWAQSGSNHNESMKKTVQAISLVNVYMLLARLDETYQGLRELLSNGQLHCLTLADAEPFFEHRNLLSLKSDDFLFATDQVPLALDSRHPSALSLHPQVVATVIDKLKKQYGVHDFGKAVVLLSLATILITIDKAIDALKPLVKPSWMAEIIDSFGHRERVFTVPTENRRSQMFSAPPVFDFVEPEQGIFEPAGHYRYEKLAKYVEIHCVMDRLFGVRLPIYEAVVALENDNFPAYNTFKIMREVMNTVYYDVGRIGPDFGAEGVPF